MPYRPFRRFNSLMRNMEIRVPLMPLGWPKAMAPVGIEFLHVDGMPLGIQFPDTGQDWAAKASLISMTMSVIFNPARLRALGMA